MGGEPVDFVRAVAFLRRRLEAFGSRSPGPPKGGPPAAGRADPLTLDGRVEAAEAEARRVGRRGRASDGLVRVARLALHVETLEKAGTQGLELCLRRLVDNPAAFDSTAYELQCAAHFAARGMPVAFLRENLVQGQRTHDFDVVASQRFHVECKRLEPLPPPMREHEQSADRLLDALEEAPESRSFGAVILRTPLLKAADVGGLLAAMRQLLAANGPGTYPVGDDAVAVLQGKGEPAPATQATYRRVHERHEADFVEGSRSSQVFSVEVDGVPDRASKAVGLLKEACQQLPPDAAGLVCLSIAGMTKRGLGGSLGAFADRVALVLAGGPPGPMQSSSRTHVSACLLTVDEETVQDGNRILTTRSKTVLNPRARFPTAPEMLPPAA